jgi:hypothetical protein
MRATPPRVADPGVRYFLRVLRRALLMVTAAIDAVAPEEDGAPCGRR